MQTLCCHHRSLVSVKESFTHPFKRYNRLVLGDIHTYDARVGDSPYLGISQHFLELLLVSERQPGLQYLEHYKIVEKKWFSDMTKNSTSKKRPATSGLVSWRRETLGPQRPQDVGPPTSRGRGSRAAAQETTSGYDWSVARGDGYLSSLKSDFESSYDHQKKLLLSW